MTTPPTPAGWYPDPDGTGGQRYWDGTAWTEPPAPAQDAPPAAAEEPSSWPSELPPWPTDMEMPSWEDAGGQPTTESEDQQTEAAPPEATPPEATPPEATPPEATPPETTEPAEQVWAPEPETVEAQLPDPATTVVPTYTPAPAEPSAFSAAPAAPSAFSAAPAAPATGNGNLLKGYLGAVGVLLVALIAVLVYALVIHKPDSGRLSLPATSSEPSATESAAAPAPPATAEPAPTATPAVGTVVDGDVTFTANGVDIGPSVVAPDNDQLTKTAAGEFVVVHLTVTNTGATPATFVADPQVLTAGGQTFTPDAEATSYLGGAAVVVNPGESAAVSVAFDVPPGSAPESLQLHGDPSSAGAALPLG